MQKDQIEMFKTKFTEILDGYELNFEEAPVDTASGDDADKCIANSTQALDLKLKGRKALYARKVEKALDKIEEGTFGECDECGAGISFERLQARPTACLCINCKEEQERVETHILYNKKSHTAGKQLIA